jgi:lipopolysaccharide export system permease protein
MNIIDRYLLRQFVQAFLICLLSLTGLFIVFDAFTNLQEFMRCGAKSGGVWPLIARHYAYQSILVFDQTAGFLALVAAMFTVSWIQRHNEMTALMAAGIARIRVVLPLIIAAATISLVAAANRELLIPRYRTEMSRRPQDLIGDLPQSLELRYDNQTDVLLGGKNTYADRCRIDR